MCRPTSGLSSRSSPAAVRRRCPWPRRGRACWRLNSRPTRRPAGRFSVTQPKTRSNVMYMDHEMTEADLRERLSDLGYGPDDDLSRLNYYQLPELPGLDRDVGGEVLVSTAVARGVQLVVVDTMARAVQGAESDADTYRAFYWHTGRRLKAHVGSAPWCRRPCWRRGARRPPSCSPSPGVPTSPRSSPGRRSVGDDSPADGSRFAPGSGALWRPRRYRTLRVRACG